VFIISYVTENHTFTVNAVFSVGTEFLVSVMKSLKELVSWLLLYATPRIDIEIALSG
jgi:hypothetical protein